MRNVTIGKSCLAFILILLVYILLYASCVIKFQEMVYILFLLIAHFIFAFFLTVPLLFMLGISRALWRNVIKAAMIYVVCFFGLIEVTKIQTKCMVAYVEAYPPPRPLFHNSLTTKGTKYVLPVWRPEYTELKDESQNEVCLDLEHNLLVLILKEKGQSLLYNIDSGETEAVFKVWKTDSDDIRVSVQREQNKFIIIRPDGMVRYFDIEKKAIDIVEDLGASGPRYSWTDPEDYIRGLAPLVDEVNRRSYLDFCGQERVLSSEEVK